MKYFYYCFVTKQKRPRPTLVPKLPIQAASIHCTLFLKFIHLWILFSNLNPPHLNKKKVEQNAERIRYRCFKLTKHSCAVILEQSMCARNRVEIGLSYRPARLYRLAVSIP